MQVFRHVLLNGHRCSHVKLPYLLYSTRQLPIPTHIRLFVVNSSVTLQIRQKSRKSNSQRTAPSPPPLRSTPLPKPQSSSTSSPLRPIPPQKTVDVIYQKPTKLYSIILDFKNWRHSRLLLSTVVNGAAFIVFSLWTYEAYKASKEQQQLKDAKTPNASNNDDPSKGRFVPGTTTETRYLTPGQEWLLDNFTVTPLNVREHRYWTFFTSLFSHQLPSHTFFNMLASHFLFTGLAPFGTVPVASAFIIGGVTANMIMAAWQVKRGSTNFDNKYPGQFHGGLGMSAANLSLLGFAAAVYPKWIIQFWGVVPVKISYVIIGAWVVEVVRYWQQEGWDKIQSSPDGHLMGILVGLVMGVLYRNMRPLPSFVK